MLLLIDDNRDLRESLMEFLALHGHTVQMAENGMDALELLRSWKIPPELILLDLMMPILDGWTFLAERRRDPRLAIVPVVIMSGSRGITSRAKAAGAAAVMHKPFPPEDLLPIIAQYLAAA